MTTPLQHRSDALPQRLRPLTSPSPLSLLLGLTLLSSAAFAQPAPAPAPTSSTTAPQAVLTAKGGLSRVLQAAVLTHPSVRKAESEREASAIGIDEARARYLPTLSAQTNQGSESKVTWGLIRLQQPIWAGGKLDAGVDIAQSQFESSDAALLDSRRQMMEQAASAYAAVIGLRTQLATAKAGVEEHEKLLDLIKRRREGGIASESDIRLAMARLATVRTQARDIGGQLRRQELDLSILTGGQATADDPLPTLYMNWAAPSELLAQARDAAPGVRRRQRDVQTVRHQASLHEAERWPTVYLRVDHDTGPTPTVYNQPATRTGLYVEANVDGSGFVGYQRIKADAARIAAAEEDVRAASFEVDRRLKILLNDRELAVQQLQDYDNVVQTQEQSLESALRQYDAGRKNWVDVLNTQRELLDARLSRDRARQTADDAQLRVAVMCGTLDPLAGLQ